MAATFVPFFEKVASGESVPQYQFNQCKLSKVTLSPTQSIQPRVDRTDLRSKVVGDLRNALRLSLPTEVLSQIQEELSSFPADYEMSPEGAADGDMAVENEPPTLELKREGDKITQIVVGCVCGQSISLDCVY